MKRRLPWVIILVVTALIAGILFGYYFGQRQ